MFLPATIGTLLSYLDLGFLTAEKFAELIQTMNTEDRDLTEDELIELDIERDATHGSIQAAIQRKRDREAT